MNEHHPPRMKCWQRLFRRNHSYNHLSDESDGRRVTTGSAPSLRHPSQTGSSRTPCGFFRNLFSKICFTLSPGQSPNPPPIISDSTARDHLSNRPSSDPSPHTTQASDQHLVQHTNTGEVQPELSDPRERIKDAGSGLDAMDTFTEPIIAPLEAFNSFVDTIGNIHPSAKAVLNIFTCASNMIIKQKGRDDAIRDLHTKLSEVYTFLKEDKALAEVYTLKEDKTLAEIPTQGLFRKLAQQTLECADFINQYSEKKSAWERLGENVCKKETDTIIQSYNKVLDDLMQQFRDVTLRETVVTVHRITEDLDFKDMVYVDGAGRNTSKCCLSGTRKDILSEIETWIKSTGEDVERVFWLSGAAGKGKSAIAHTIADWFQDRGAFFCFDRSRETQERHTKIFKKIARDLADCDPIMRRTLASVVRDKNELRHTTDIVRQWEEFILRPVNAASKAVAAPVLIVIDALDESGEPLSRKEILLVLAGKLDTSSSELTKLPKNIRVLVTSRPLLDICNSLHGASHVRHVSMHDTSHMSSESSERDIQRYITIRLKHLQPFNDGDFKKLAVKSGGLFQWAYLACEYIDPECTDTITLGPTACLSAVVDETPGEEIHLLDKMYRRILKGMLRREGVIPMFCSVMGQILASLEPLSLTSLTVMRRHFPSANKHYMVDQVIRPLGSLITGTTDPHTPIRLLHASFYEFLTDPSRSEMFFIDVPSARRDLAFAPLRVMTHHDGLRFNICSLESSYLLNSAIPDLEERVRKFIPAALSYSCRFWGTHVSAASLEPALVKEVEAFFDGERLLFWLEAVTLLGDVSGSVGTLSCISTWLTGHAEYAHIADAVKDTQRFVRTCALAISRSTPHLYLSALPLAPIESRIFKTFAAKFPCTPRVVGGHVTHWPVMEKTLHVNRSVETMAISRDGRNIVCGHEDGRIYIRDMETGEVLSALIGHTKSITSVAISPHGDYIVSGSQDRTIRVWDAVTGQTLGAPLQGHTGIVQSVAISPDGRRIVSGSSDGTIRVWDMVTGEALLEPLRGHTGGVRSIAISPGGNRIVSSSFGGTVRMWCMGTGNPLGEPLQGTNITRVNSVAISPDGRCVVSGSEEGTIQVWDATTGKVSHFFQGHTGCVCAVVISPDGHSIVSGSWDKMIGVWDARTGKALAMLQGHASAVTSVAVSPDGNRIVSSSHDNTIRVWDADTGMAVAAPSRGYTSEILSVAISADGNRIVSGSADNMVQVWDAHTGKALLAPFQGHAGAVRSVAISMDDKFIVSGSFDGTIRVWDGMTGEALGRPLRGYTSAQHVSISPDGTRIVSGSSDTICVWDVVTLEEFCEPLKVHDGDILSVKFSLDGKHIISASSNATIHVWDAVTCQTLGPPHQWHTCSAQSAAISLDVNLIVSENHETMQIWDAENGEMLGTLELEGITFRHSSIVISPDGRNIICSDGKRIRIWNMENGKALCLLEPLQGHTRDIYSIASSLDGKHIVSGSLDKTIRVWNLESLTRSKFLEAPGILFSSNATHALWSASSFLQDFRSSDSLIPNEEGWLVGPKGRLLLWIPAALYPVVHGPYNTLVIPGNALQLDLSHFAHGRSWDKCREQEAGLSSSLSLV